MNEMGVAKQVFYPHHDKKRNKNQEDERKRKGVCRISLTRRFISFHLAELQLIVSIKARDRKRISLIESYVSR